MAERFYGRRVSLQEFAMRALHHLRSKMVTEFGYLRGGRELPRRFHIIGFEPEHDRIELAADALRKDIIARGSDTFIHPPSLVDMPDCLVQYSDVYDPHSGIVVRVRQNYDHEAGQMRFYLEAVTAKLLTVEEVQPVQSAYEDLGRQLHTVRDELASIKRYADKTREGVFEAARETTYPFKHISDWCGRAIAKAGGR